jgi:hypothetical protein
MIKALLDLEFFSISLFVGNRIARELFKRLLSYPIIISCFGTLGELNIGLFLT